MLLSIVIPTYNEEKDIVNSLNSISQYLKEKGYDYEIIVSDDGSTDQTFEKVEEATRGDKRIRALKNKHAGKGAAVRTGMLNAKGEYILFTDVDLSTPIGELEKLIKFLQRGYDLAIASRGLKESQIKRHQSFFREKMGKLFNFLMRQLLKMEIKDTQCGFKCFSRPSAQHLFKLQQFDGWIFDAEILYIAKKHGYKIAEVPVKWHHDPNSKVQVLKEGLRSLVGLLKIRFNDLKGKYNHAPRTI